MPPKPDLKAEGKLLGDLLSEARRKTLNFAFLNGRDGMVVEIDLRKPTAALVRAAKAAGGTKGACGQLRAEGNKLILVPEDDVPGGFELAAKKHFAARGHAVQIVIEQPEAEADARPEPPAEEPAETAQTPKPQAAFKPATEEEESDDDAVDPDDDDDDLSAARGDLEALVRAVRRKPYNFAWLIGKDGPVLRSHKRKKVVRLLVDAKKAGGTPRGAWGVMTAEGATVVLTCDDKPFANFGRIARNHLRDNGIRMRVELRWPGGSDAAEDEDAAPAPDAAVAGAAATSRPASEEKIAALKSGARDIRDALTAMLRGAGPDVQGRIKTLLTAYATALGSGDTDGATLALNALRQSVGQPVPGDSTAGAVAASAEVPASDDLATRPLAADLAMPDAADADAAPAADAPDDRSRGGSSDGPGGGTAIEPDAAAAFARLPAGARKIVNDETDRIFYARGHLPQGQKITSPGQAEAQIWMAIRHDVISGLGAEVPPPPPGEPPPPDAGSVFTSEQHHDEVDRFQGKELKLTPEQIGAITLYADNNALGAGGAAGKGGQKLLDALRGKSPLGKLTPAMQAALTERFAMAWMYSPGDDPSGAGQNLDDLVRLLKAPDKDQPDLAPLVARALFRISASVPQNQHTGENYDVLEKQREIQGSLRDHAIDLDPMCTTAAMGNGDRIAEMLLGQVEWRWIPGTRFSGNPDRYGQKAPKPDEARVNAVINAVAKGALKPDEAKKFFDRVFTSSSDLDVSPVDSIFGSVFDYDQSTEAQQESMAELLGHTVNRVHAKGDEAVAAFNRRNMAEIMSSPGGRAMLFTTSMSTEERLWALDMMSMTSGAPDKKPWTKDQLKDGWESDVVGKAFAGKAVEAAKAAPKVHVGDASDRGALANVIGETFGLKQKDLKDETEPQRKARRDEGFGASVYTDDSGPMKKILDKIGTEASIATIPISLMNRENGAFLFKLVRVEKAAGKPYFLNEKGDTFTDEDHWWELSDLPPGKLTYPGKLDLANPLVSRKSKNSGTWERVVDKADEAVKIAGMAAGALLVIGTGGAAAPLVAGVAAGYSAVRGVQSLIDKSEMGHDITDLGDADIRGIYFDVVTNALSTVTMGSTKLVSAMTKEGARVSRAGASLIAGMTWTGNIADAAQLADKINTLSDKWKNLSEAERDKELVSLGFAMGMKGVSTARGGKLKDQFSYARLRNQIEHGTPVSVEKAKDGDLPDDMTIGVVHRDGKVLGIRYKGDYPDPAMMALHADAATAMEASFALTARIRREFGLKSGQEPPPGSAAWEAFHELNKINGELDSNIKAMAGADKAGREALAARQVELNAAVLKETARLDHWDEVGKGAVGAPEKGLEAAKRLKIDTVAEKRGLIAEGYRWVAAKDGGAPYLYKPGKPRLVWDESSRQFMSEADAAEFAQSSRAIERSFNRTFDETKGPRKVVKIVSDEEILRTGPEAPDPQTPKMTQKQFARALANQLKLTIKQLDALRKDMMGQPVSKEWAQQWAQAVAKSDKAAAALNEIRRLTRLADKALKNGDETLAADLYGQASKLGKEAYNQVRSHFWKIVTGDPALVARLKKEYGLTVEEGRAPYLLAPDPAKPGKKIKLEVTLEHFDRKSDVPLRAQDPSNLLFSFNFENTKLLEAIRGIVTAQMGEPQVGETNPML